MDERWTVSFDPNNGESAWYVTVPKGKKVAAPSLKTGHGRTFSGWFDGTGRLWSFADAVNGNITLTAMWDDGANEGRTVTFGPDNGCPVRSAATGGREPPGEGWKFLGWYDGETKLDPDSVNDDATRTAMWIEGSEEADEECPDATSAEILMSALAFILLMQKKGGPKVVGTVKQNDEGVPGMTVMYTADGRTGTVTTDSFGRFVIPVSIGTEIEVVSVGGRGIIGTFAVTIQKKITEVNIGI